MRIFGYTSDHLHQQEKRTFQLQRKEMHFALEYYRWISAAVCVSSTTTGGGLTSSRVGWIIAQTMSFKVPGSTVLTERCCVTYTFDWSDQCHCGRLASTLKIKLYIHILRVYAASKQNKGVVVLYWSNANWKMLRCWTGPFSVDGRLSFWYPLCIILHPSRK